MYSGPSLRAPSGLSGSGPDIAAYRVGGQHTGSRPGESYESGTTPQGNNSINKYDHQTRQQVNHPLRGDPARLHQPISIRLDHERETVPVKN